MLRFPRRAKVRCAYPSCDGKDASGWREQSLSEQYHPQVERGLPGTQRERGWWYVGTGLEKPQQASAVCEKAVIGD